MRTQKTNATPNQINPELNDSMIFKGQEEIQMTDAQQRAQEWAAKKIAQEAVTKALQSANPHLKAGQDCAIAAKNIRTELKKAFPGIKFKVTTSRFSGGDAVRVGWTDGVTVDDIDAIANKYRGGDFDGSNDLYTYADSAWINAFGSAKYISTSREYSPEFVQNTINGIAAEFHDGELPTAEDYRRGRLYSTSPDRHCETWQHLIYRAMCKKTSIN